MCQLNPLVKWAAYIGGSIFTLLKEEPVKLPFGFSLLLLSAVPMNVGIGSSAAVEIGALLSERLPGAWNSTPRAGPAGTDRRKPRRRRALRHHGPNFRHQRAEGRLTHILCRPGAVVGEVEIPSGTGFVGINSMVRHSVAGNPYGDTRIGAFMGKKIINDIRARTGRAALDYLTELPLAEFQAQFAPEIPGQMVGSEFLARYKTHDDPVTKIQPDATYRVAGPTRHPIEENERVLHFIECLRAGQRRRRARAASRPAKHVRGA